MGAFITGAEAFRAWSSCHSTTIRCGWTAVWRVIHAWFSCYSNTTSVKEEADILVIRAWFSCYSNTILRFTSFTSNVILPTVSGNNSMRLHAILLNPLSLPAPFTTTWFITPG